MNQDKAIQLLAEELSITRLALAQVICNYERQYGYKSWTTIAAHWRGYAAQLPRQEWIAGKNAILHYLMLLETTSANQAIEFLNSPQSEYTRNRKLFRGIYRRRGGKTDKAYERGFERLMAIYMPHPIENPGIDLHGAIRGAFAGVGEFLRACKTKSTR